MTIEAHSALVSQILENIADQATVSTLLSQLSDDYVNTISALTSSQQETENLKQEVSNLKESNMQLFLKVTQPATQDEDEEDNDEELKFEDLFNENGELK